MLRHILVFCLAVLPALAADVGRTDSQSQAIAGTYEVVICKREPCSLEDRRNAQVSGHIVLAERRVSSEDFPVDTQRFIGRGFESTGSNGCFGLTRHSLAPMTNAGIGDGNVIYWSPAVASRDRVSITLYRSPDSANGLTASITNGALRGTGTSRGIGAGSPPSHWGDDIVVGRRIGDVDLKPCVEGANRYLAKLRGGFQRNALSALPQIGDTDAGETRPASFRFILFLSAPLLEPPTRFERPGAPYRPGIHGIGQMYGEPDIVTIGVSGRMADVSAYAAETASRVRTLLEHGVAASHITVVGAGASTAIAVEVMRQIREPIGAVFVGGCGTVSGTTSGDPRPGGAESGAHPILDIAESDTSTAERCSTRLGADKTAHLITVPARPKSAYAGSMSGWLPPHVLAARPEDWIDAMVSWIRRR